MATVELTDNQFRKISSLVYSYCGIRLNDGKEALVRARLLKRLRTLGIGSMADYLSLVESGQGRTELDQMIDLMTTNKTSFFREADHFDFLRDNILSGLDDRRMRIWSAACSSGQEPYSIAVTLLEAVPDASRRDILVLGTDISGRMLEIARRGLYGAKALADVPADMMQRYFTRSGRDKAAMFEVAPAVRNLVRLARLNLMHRWPMQGPLDVIFCRNVMIYFDRQTQQKLVDRFCDILAPGGYLFVGLSEGLSAVKHKLRFVRPAVYRK